MTSIGKTHNFENSFSGRLLRLLEEKGLSQDGLRLLLGATSTGLVSNWIKRNRPPRPEMLLKLAKVLDTTPDYLLHGEIPEPEGDGNLNETARWRDRALKAEQKLAHIEKSAAELLAEIAEGIVDKEMAKKKGGSATGHHGSAEGHPGDGPKKPTAAKILKTDDEIVKAFEELDDSPSPKKRRAGRVERSK